MSDLVVFLLNNTEHISIPNHSEIDKGTQKGYNKSFKAFYYRTRDK